MKHHLCQVPRSASRIFTRSMAALLMAGSSFSVFAADNVWIGGTSSDYNEASNWSFGRVPTNASGDSLAIRTTPANIATLSSGTPPQVVDIRIGESNDAGTFGTFFHSGGTLSSGNGNWTAIGAGSNAGTAAVGVYNLTSTTATAGTLAGFGQGSGILNANSRLYVGGTDDGAYNPGGNGTLNINTTNGVTVTDTLFIGARQATGTVNLESGTLNRTGGETFIGQNGGNGTFNMSGGTVTGVNNTIVGENTGSVGALNISGGSYGSNGTIQIGRNGGTGTIRVSGGALNTSNQIRLGSDNGGVGTLTVTGGDVTAASQLHVGANAGGTGTVTVTNGTLTANGESYFGMNGGNGTVTVGTGGNLAINNNWLNVGRGAGGNGTLNNNGGTVTVGNFLTVGMDGGTGTVTMTGGTTTVGQQVQVGRNGNGTLTLSGGAVLTSQQTIAIGENGANSVGNATITGVGTRLSAAQQVRIGSGNGATGTLTLTDGTVEALGNNDLFIGVGGGNGTVLMNSGAMRAGREFFVGNDDNSVGRMTVNGGEVSSNSWFHVGNNGSDGMLTINGGAVDQGLTDAGSAFEMRNSGKNTPSVVNLNGGVLTVNRIVNGASNTIGTATFNFNGGTLKARLDRNDFMQNIITADVQAGGAIIDTNGRIITINQVLLHDVALAGTADGGLTKNGAGNLTVTGQSTFTGNVVVNGGTLIASSAAAGNGTSGNLGNTATAGKTITANNGAVMSLTAANALGGGANPTMPAVVLNNSTMSATQFNGIGNVTLNNGSTLSQSATGLGNFEGFEFRGNVTVSGTGASTISSSAASGNHLGANTVFTVADTTGNAGADLIVSAPLRNRSADFGSGAGALTKLGAGTLSLTGGNTYTGGTTLSEGSISATGGGLGLGTVNVVSGANLVVDQTGGLGTIYLSNTAPVNVNQTDPAYNSLTTLRARFGGSPSVTLTTPVLNLNAGGPGNFPANVSTDNFQGYYSGLMDIVTGGTYTFSTGSDDGSVVFIDDQLVVNNNRFQGFAYPQISGAIDLTPGKHTVVVGFYEAGGGNSLRAGVSGPDTGNALLDIGATGSPVVSPDLIIGSLQGAGNVQLITAGLITGGDNSSTTHSGVISGIGGVMKIGAGTQTLIGVNTYTGKTVITNGALQLGDGTTNGTLASASNISNNATLIFNTVGASSYGGVISGTGTVAKNGTGTQTLTGINTYTGATAINAGILQLGNGTTDGAIVNSPIAIAGGSTLNFNNVGLQVSTGAISGAGAVTKTNTGTQVLAGASTYTGGTTVSAGALAVSTQSALGSGDVNLTGGTLQTYAGGIAEGRVAGNFNTTAANPTTSIQLSTRYGNIVDGSPTYPNTGGAWVDNSTYVYSGTLNNSTAGAVTYTFAEQFDDSVRLVIDGTEILNNTSFNTQTTGSITLAPGLHTIDARFGQGGGGVGPTGGGVNSNTGLGLAYSTNLDLTLRAVADNGSGSFLIAQAPIIANNINVTSSSAIDVGPLAGRTTFTGGLNVNASKLTFSSTNGQAVFSGTTNLTGATEINVNDSNVQAGAVTFNGPINGTGSLLKTGAGGMTSNGNGTFTGGTNIAQGSVTAKNTGLGTGAVNVAAGANLIVTGDNGLNGQYYDIGPANVGNANPNFNTLSALNAHLSGQTPFLTANTIGAGANFDFTQNGAAFPGKYGSTTQTNFESRYTGKIFIASDGNYYFDTRSDDGSVLFIDGVDTPVVNNNFFQGNTTRSGNVALTAGYHDITIGFYQGGGGYGLQAHFGNASTFLPNSILFSQTGGLTIGSLSGDGNVQLVAGNLLTGVNNADATFNGVISNTGGLTKTGTGLQRLTGASTYTGPTLINGGTLLVSGTGNIASSSSVTVASGGTLGGSGGTVGNIFLRNGGTIAPGESIGTLFGTSLVWDGGGAMDFELSNTPPVTSDMLTLSGGFIQGADGSYQFDFLGTGFGTFENPTTYTLVNFGSSTGFDVGDFSYTNLNGLGSFLLNPNNLQLVVIPEPGRAALMGMAALFMLGRRRRQKA